MNLYSITVVTNAASLEEQMMRQEQTGGGKEEEEWEGEEKRAREREWEKGWIAWRAVFSHLVHNSSPSPKPQDVRCFSTSSRRNSLDCEVRQVRSIFCLAPEILWNNMSRWLSSLLQLAWKDQNFYRYLWDFHEPPGSLHASVTTQVPGECIGGRTHLFLERVIITVSPPRNEPFVLCFQQELVKY